MSVTKIKIGQTVPLESTNQSISYLTNFGSPHVHITKTPAGADLFLNNANTIVGNTSNILFDSYWFNYLRIDQVVTFSVTLSSRTGVLTQSEQKGSSSFYLPNTGKTKNLIAAHGRGDVPAFFATSGDKVLSSAVYAYGSSFRTVAIVADSSNVYLNESYVAVDTPLPSVTISGTIYILKSSLTSGGGEYTPSSYGLYVSPSRVIFGQGKFDSDYNYLYLDPNGTKVYRGSALRSQSGFRVGYNPQGVALLNYSSFNNSFSIMQDSLAIYAVNNIKVASTLTDYNDPSNTLGTTMGVNVP